MQKQAILQASYLDIVFDNRNKLYGGYELRSHYQRRMTTAILIVVCACIVLAIAGSIKRHTHVNTNPVVHREIEMTHIIEPTIIKPVILPPPADAAPKINTAKLTPPVITPDNLVKPEDLPTAGKTDAVPGTGTHIGLPGDISGTIEAPKITTGIVTPPVTDTKPFTVVEQMPEFQGDMVAYLSKQLIYPPLARDNNIQGKVFIQFVVNEDGSVSNAKVIRGIGSGCDAEALRVVNSMPKWKPGKQNGKAVKVYYTLPIRFLLG